MKGMAMMSTILLLAALIQTTFSVQAQEVSKRTELVKALKPLPDHLVVLTFDDAASTHATFVDPLLKKYEFGGTFFVCEFPPDFDSDEKKGHAQEFGKRPDSCGFPSWPCSADNTAWR